MVPHLGQLVWGPFCWHALWKAKLFPGGPDSDPLGVDTFATHVLPLDEAPHAYDIFQNKQDGAVKVILQP